MAAMRSCRSVGYSVHAVLLFTSFILIAAGLLSPRWQEVTWPTGDYHEHGLWEDCIYVGTARSAHLPGNCQYKKFGTAYLPQTQTEHDVDMWRVYILALLTFAFFLDLASFVVICVTCCAERTNRHAVVRCSAICTCIVEFLGFLLAASGVVYFTVQTNDPRYRIEHDPGTNLETPQYLGLAYYIAVGGVIFGALSLLVGIGTVILSFFGDKQAGYNDRVCYQYNERVLPQQGPRVYLAKTSKSYPNDYDASDITSYDNKTMHSGRRSPDTDTPV